MGVNQVFCFINDTIYLSACEHEEVFLIQKIRCVLLAQEVAGSSPFNVMTNIFVTEFSEFSETFRKNSSFIFIFISVTTTSSTITLATTKEFKAISSPNYPNEVRYPNDAVLRITIRSPPGSFIQLNVLEFDWERFHCSYPLLINNGKLYYSKYKPTLE